MNNSNPSSLINILQKLLYLMIFEAILFLPAMGQEKPPKPIAVTVSTIQHLNFGTFIVSGAGGTVTVDSYGIRSAYNDIYLPSISSTTTPTPALFVVTALPGTLITIVNGPDAPLSSSNGGTIMLKIGQSSTGSPFVTKGLTTDVFIGGTLTVGSLSANPAGNYNGSFQITFIQQ